MATGDFLLNDQVADRIGHSAPESDTRYDCVEIVRWKAITLPEIVELDVRPIQRVAGPQSHGACCILSISLEDDPGKIAEVLDALRIPRVVTTEIRQHEETKEIRTLPVAP